MFSMTRSFSSLATRATPSQCRMTPKSKCSRSLRHALGDLPWRRNFHEQPRDPRRRPTHPDARTRHARPAGRGGPGRAASQAPRVSAGRRHGGAGQAREGMAVKVAETANLPLARAGWRPDRHTEHRRPVLVDRHGAEDPHGLPRSAAPDLPRPRASPGPGGGLQDAVGSLCAEMGVCTALWKPIFRPDDPGVEPRGIRSRMAA